MPRNGSGAYAPPAGQPVVTGTPISSVTFNALVTDLSNELTKSICTDGQTPMTAALPMGNNKITGLAAGVAGTDAACLTQLTTGLAGKVNTTDVIAVAQGGTGATTAAAALSNLGALPFTGGTLTGPFGISLANTGNTADFTNTGTSGMQIGLHGDGATTPSKTLRCKAGVLDVVNSAYSAVIMTLTDAGNLSAITVSQTSDERKKTNWRPVSDAQLDALANMEKSGLFDWIDGSGESCGGSAQEIEAIVPQAVYTDEHGDKTVNYGGLCFAVQQATLRRLWGSK